MRFVLSDKVKVKYETLQTRLQKQVIKQLDFLVKNIRHPSLHAKKYDEATGLWQARVNKDWRFYFLITADAYYIVSIRKHPK